jgi:hypothetical protein
VFTAVDWSALGHLLVVSPVKNILDNRQAMAVLEEAVSKLQSLGIASVMCPCSFEPHGKTVSLHIGETEAAAAAAHVAQTCGAIVSRSEPEEFAHEFAAYQAENAIFTAQINSRR